MTEGDDASRDLLAELLSEHHDLESSLDNFRAIGRVIGAVYNGVRSQDVPADDAFMITRDWMECHVFDKLQLIYRDDDINENTDLEDEDAS